MRQPPSGFVVRPPRVCFDDTIGPTYVSEDGPPWRLGLFVADKHANPHGRLDGGAVATLADHAIGNHIFRTLDDGTSAVTVSLTVDFVAAGKVGAWVEAVPEIVRSTRSLIFARARILEGGSRPLATASGVWKRLEGR